MTNSGSGRFSAGASFTAPDLPGLAAGDFDGDGNIDLQTVSLANQFSVLLGTGSGTFQAAITVATGVSSGPGYWSASKVTDFNGDGRSDVVISSVYFFGTLQYAILLSNGDGTFQVSDSGSLDAPQGMATGDINGDGAPDIVYDSRVFPAGTNYALIQDVDESASSTSISLLTQASAQSALSTLTTFAEGVGEARSAVGAYLSRLSVTDALARSRKEQFATAASRIVDLDVAEAVAELLQVTIRQQVATSLLAQSNLMEELVLKLL
jgi:flagellin-like hook-associated protein FlgL